MIKFKYPFAVIVHSHLLHYDGKPESMYLQQIDHLIGKIKMAVGVQFLIMWSAFHCMRDSSSSIDQIFSSPVLPHIVVQSS